MNAPAPTSPVRSKPTPDRRSSLRAEFRAIAAVYVFSALLPLIAGFACSSDRERRMEQREQAADQPASSPAAARQVPAPSQG